ncbi:MAG: hypothetical protein SFY69_09250 [Planctomycetota bacterium]|nr:hypothetical protein [Planctomycetota bacterium]
MRTQLLIAVSLLSLPVFAQPAQPVRVFPLSIMWQSTPTGYGGDPFVTPMQTVDVHWRPYYPNPQNPTPESAAAALAQRVLADFTSNLITPDNVCVIVRGFGHDTERSDPTWFATEQNLPALGFWTPGTTQDPGPDVLRWPNGTPLTPFNFPEAPTNYPPDPNSPNYPGDARFDARPWRHPFPVNATLGGPLRAWMVEFVDELDAQIAAIRVNNPAFPPVSDWRFYFDVEAFILTTGSRNGVFMPWFLASQAGDPNSIWNTWKVPGSPGWVPPQSFPGSDGMTLAEMWNAAAAAYGWIVDPDDAFNFNRRADHPDNRPYMIWWMSIWRNVHQAVMDNAAYSVLRAKFGSSIRVGNYNGTRTDGALDQVGWHLPPQQSGPVNELNRCWIDHQPVFGQLPATQPPQTRHNVATSPARYDVWAGYVQSFGSAQSSPGMVDSPELYPVSYLQLGTDEYGNPLTTHLGHRQPNQYLPGTPYETRFEASTRLHRHAAESVINSFEGNRWDKLVP